MKAVLDRIEIKQKEDSLKAGHVMCGHNTNVFVNGEILEHVISVDFKVDAGGIARVKLEMLGSVTVKGNMVNQEEKSESNTPFRDLVNKLKKIRKETLGR